MNSRCGSFAMPRYLGNDLVPASETRLRRAAAPRLPPGAGPRPPGGLGAATSRPAPTAGRALAPGPSRAPASTSRGRARVGGSTWPPAAGRLVRHGEAGAVVAGLSISSTNARAKSAPEISDLPDSSVSRIVAAHPVLAGRLARVVGAEGGRGRDEEPVRPGRVGPQRLQDLGRAARLALELVGELWRVDQPRAALGDEQRRRAAHHAEPGAVRRCRAGQRGERLEQLGRRRRCRPGRSGSRPR